MEKDRGDWYSGNYTVINNTGHEMRLMGGLYAPHTFGRIEGGELKGKDLPDTYFWKNPTNIPNGQSMNFEARTAKYIPGDASHQYWSAGAGLAFGLDRDIPGGGNPDIYLTCQYGYLVWKAWDRNHNMNSTVDSWFANANVQSTVSNIVLQAGQSWDPYRVYVEATVSLA
ncbi:hypothetical protein [Streptomyces violascens]|uniref:hypothetical protein n=1 Tax=Streptomyces violascens TaxID=67381 RepID=UPI0036983E5A